MHGIKLVKVNSTKKKKVKKKLKVKNRRRNDYFGIVCKSKENEGEEQRQCEVRNYFVWKERKSRRGEKLSPYNYTFTH